MSDTYSLYECQTDIFLDNFKKSTPRAARRHLKDKDIVQIVLVDNPALQATGTYPVLADELDWMAKDAPIIFPENEHVLDNLLNAKFTVSSIDGFSMPYETFIMAMPKGYTHNGQVISSFMASFDQNSEHATQRINRFARAYDLKVQHAETNKAEDTRMMRIVYNSSTGNPVNNVFSIPAKLIPALLNCKDYQDFERHLLESKDDYGFTRVSVEEKAFTIFRLALATSVYNMATEKSRLAEGYPGSNKKDVKMAYPNRVPKAITLTAPKAKTDDLDIKKAHYRTWHFRQLRADCYYQGEYTHLEKGSRYAFVQDTVVNRKVSPATLIDQSTDFTR